MKDLKNDRKHFMSMTTGMMSSIQTQINILAFSDHGADQCEIILELINSLQGTVKHHRQIEKEAVGMSLAKDSRYAGATNNCDARPMMKSTLESMSYSKFSAIKRGDTVNGMKVVYTQLREGRATGHGGTPNEFEVVFGNGDVWSHDAWSETPKKVEY